jgi:hypothetical protein
VHEAAWVREAAWVHEPAWVRSASAQARWHRPRRRRRDLPLPVPMMSPMLSATPRGQIFLPDGVEAASPDFFLQPWIGGEQRRSLGRPACRRYRRPDHRTSWHQRHPNLAAGLCRHPTCQTDPC